MLHSQAPNYCTAQRFNLFLATTLSTKAPMPGVALVSACKGSPVNPFVLGCIACVLSDGWKDDIEDYDLFSRGYSYASEAEAIAYALQQAMLAVDLENFPELNYEQVVKVKEMYSRFVRFSQKLGGANLPVEHEPKPKPIKVEPIEVKPEPKPLPVNPPVVPQPEKPVEKEKVILPVPNVPKWKTKTKIVLGSISAAITMTAIFIPDYIEVPLRLLIKLISEIISF